MHAQTTAGDRWDRREFVESMGGDEDFAGELLKVFLAECPGLLASVRQAVAQADGPAVYRSAHSLKGAVGHFTTGRPYAAALNLEQAGRSGDLTQARELLAAIEREFAGLLASMTGMTGVPAAAAAPS